jgi:hypothetical protein
MKRGLVGAVLVLVLASLTVASSGIAAATSSQDGANQKSGHQKGAEKNKNKAAHHPKGPVKVELVNAGWPGAGTAGAREAECPDTGARPVDTPAQTLNPEPKQAIKFTVQESNPVLNFGPGRATQEDYVVLRASEKIPREVSAANFEIDTVEPMRRIGEASLLSSHLPAPTYTEPHFFNHRTEISFTLCVAGNGKDAGTYTGQYQFISPGSIETATLTQTAQLKTNESSFILCFICVMVLAGLLLIVNQIVLAGRPKGVEWVARLVVIVLSLAAAASAMLLAWSQNATWGENIWVAIGALVATAFAAAGLGGTLTTAAAQINTPGSSTATDDGETTPS